MFLLIFLESQTRMVNLFGMVLQVIGKHFGIETASEVFDADLQIIIRDIECGYNRSFYILIPVSTQRII